MTMRRTGRVAALAAAAAVALSGCAESASRATAAGPPSSEVRIGLVEWGFTTSASALVAGPVVLEVTNAGSTPHDMQVIVDGEVVARTEVLRPGEAQTVRADLSGVDTASLLCTLPGHESQGMVQEIEVVEGSAAEEREGSG
ncbi:MAG TPA: hypothetical protein VFZ64_08320 [Nocardioidaceae bacterium]